ncbi:hypothetical protein H0H93_004812 [Arthromyces matolae]|nr:hypothetical protein H0H93_004812 [Arthromyces matolae]
MSRSPHPRERQRDSRMDVDRAEGGSGGPAKGELKIKGQGERNNRKAEYSDEDADNNSADLEKRENELKEKALRNKVMRSRKTS